MNTSTNPQRRPARPGFTLVEILTVIVIIGILAAIAIPAINGAVRTARATAMKLDVNAIDAAVVRYELEFGDFPPDFSSYPIVVRHYRKLFPRMSANESQLLFNLLHAGTTFQAANIDRAEAIVWTLGGYSKDVQRPFTGDGGPLVWVGDGTNTYEDPDGNGMVDASDNTERQTVSNYQYNNDRINSFFDFNPQLLTVALPNPSAPFSASNKYISTDDSDLFPVYLSREDGAPFVYFDSRTYAVNDPTLGYNGYADTANGFGAVRPYYSQQANPNITSSNFASIDVALQAWDFINPDTYQIISAGIDGSFGTVVNRGTPPQPLYFQYPTGNAIVPATNVGTAGDLLLSGVTRYQENGTLGASESFSEDNIANFSEGPFVDDVPQ